MVDEDEQGAFLLCVLGTSGPQGIKGDLCEPFMVVEHKEPLCCALAQAGHMASET